MIFYVDSEGPNQCADAQADIGLRCPQTPLRRINFPVKRLIYTDQKKETQHFYM